MGLNLLTVMFMLNGLMLVNKFLEGTEDDNNTVMKDSDKRICSKGR